MLSSLCLNKFKIVFVVFLLCFQVVNAQQFPTIETEEITIIDESRGNREIPIKLCYPVNENGELPVEKLPLLVFGHGFVMGIDAYQNFVDELVPEGYYLALVNTEDSFTPSHDDFAKDLAFTINQLLDMSNNDAMAFFYNKLSSASVMGHSMGGGAAFLSLQYSSNIKTLVTFAPAETSPSAIESAETINVPTLIFSGSEDCITPINQHQQPMFNTLNVDETKMLINIQNGTHCAFSSGSITCEFGEQASFCTQILDNQGQYFFPFVKVWLLATLKNNCFAWETFWNDYDSNTALNSGIQSIQEVGELNFETEDLTITQSSDDPSVIQIVNNIDESNVSWFFNNELSQTGGATFISNEVGNIQAILNYGLEVCETTSNVIYNQSVSTHSINHKYKVVHFPIESRLVINGMSIAEVEVYNSLGQLVKSSQSIEGYKANITYYYQSSGTLFWMAKLSNGKNIYGKILKQL